MKNWSKVFLFLLMSGLLVYSNSLNNKFLIDDSYFIKNPVLSDTKYILSQWNPFREQALGVLDYHEMITYYRPMQHMVLDFCYGIFKENYWQYHLLNLFLFVFASSLIFLLIEKTTGNFNLAFLTSLFYLIHPINGVVVNYISASVFAFQVIFLIGALLLLLGSLERKNDRVLYILSLIVSFLSLFWHESGIMVPFYVSAFILLLGKDPFKKKVIYLLPYFLFPFFYIIFRFFFIGISSDIVKQLIGFKITEGEYLANLFRGLMWYISQLFYPRGIVLSWASPIIHDHIFFYALGACLLPLLLLLLFIKFSKEKILQLAIAWIVIGFAPVCFAALMSPKIGVQMEPHWFIISSIGFFILAAYFCMFILGRMRKTGFVVLFILIFTWGAISHANNRFWSDQRTYALYWAQNAPDLRQVNEYLADAYKEQGGLEESRKYYRLALSGNPSDENTYNNLGLIDQAEGHYRQAESMFLMALKISPYLAGTYNNLALLYSSEGKFNKAEENFNKSMMLDPLLMEPRRGLADIFLEHSEYQKAIDLCLKNLEIKKDDQKTLYLLVKIFIKTNDQVNLKKYAYSIINSETDPKSLTGLGVMMAQNHEPVIALDCFEKTIRVAPDYKDVYLDAGTLFANLGKYDEAIKLWKIGLSIDPSDQRFKDDIAKANRRLVNPPGF